MPTNYNFTGQRLDSQTGLLYYIFRYYDSVSGRFLRADSMQNNANGMDPFAYVGDNPETKNDPTGHCGFCVGLVLIAALAITGAVVGTIAGAITTYAQGLAEDRTPTWQEYRDNMEIGAGVGALTGLIALPITVLPGSEIVLGALFFNTFGLSFTTAALTGIVTGAVHRINNETTHSSAVENQGNGNPSWCRQGYTCRPNTPTPTATPTPQAKPKPTSSSNSYTVSSLWYARDSYDSYTYTSWNTYPVSNGHDTLWMQSIWKTNYQRLLYLNQ